MVPENILWAFFSPSHYQQIKEMARMEGKTAPNDVYYKDFNGKWVKVTQTFDCIEIARKTYRHNDAKYLGGVLANTKAEVARGAVYPPPATTEPVANPIKKKKKLNRPVGMPGTIAVKRSPYEWYNYGGTDQ